MTTYSVAQARNRIAELIYRVLAGEPVAITRRGKHVVNIVPSEDRRTAAPLDLEWIDRHRVTLSKPLDDPEGIGIVGVLRQRDGEL